MLQILILFRGSFFQANIIPRGGGGVRTATLFLVHMIPDYCLVARGRSKNLFLSIIRPKTAPGDPVSDIEKLFFYGFSLEKVIIFLDFSLFPWFSSFFGLLLVKNALSRSSDGLGWASAACTNQECVSSKDLNTKNGSSEPLDAFSRSTLLFFP